MNRTVYTLPVETEQQMAHAERRQREAYALYNSVQVFPHMQNGREYVRIECSNPIVKPTIDTILD